MINYLFAFWQLLVASCQCSYQLQIVNYCQWLLNKIIITLPSLFLSLTVAMARLSITLRILLQALHAHTRHWASWPPPGPWWWTTRCCRWCSPSASPTSGAWLYSVSYWSLALTGPGPHLIWQSIQRFNINHTPNPHPLYSDMRHYCWYGMCWSHTVIIVITSVNME